MRKVALVLLGLLALVPAVEAQNVEESVEADGGWADASLGFGYATGNSLRIENLFASAEFKGISFGPADMGALTEFAYDLGEFKYRIFARGAVQVAGPVYAAVDTRVNGSERDPRAVVGFNFNRLKVEAYGQVDGDRLYGFAVRFPLF